MLFAVFIVNPRFGLPYVDNFDFLNLVCFRLRNTIRYLFFNQLKVFKFLSNGQFVLLFDVIIIVIFLVAHSGLDQPSDAIKLIETL